MSARSLDALLESAFRIRLGERRRVALMFAYIMGVVSTFIVGRTVGATLFLSRYPVERLPYMYVVGAAVVSAASLTYARYADRHRRDKVIVASLLPAALVFAVLWVLLALDLAGSWVYPTLYLAVEAVGAVTVVQFWTFANDIFSAREAKRLFGVIGAGGVISNVTCGFLIGSLAKQIGAENLLVLCVALLAGCVWCVRAVARVASEELEASIGKPKRRAGASRDGGLEILRSKHLRMIAGIVIATVLTVTIVDYQFNVIARGAYAGQEDALAAYFGHFFALTGIVACVIQFFITGRLLERRGIIVALLVLPCALMVGATSLAALVPMFPIIPILWAGTFTKGTENVFRYTLNDAVMNLLYVPVPAHQRGRAKAFVDGILKPVSRGASGLLILGLARTGAGAERAALHLAWVDVLLLAAWIALVVGIRKEYLSSLVDTLRSRRLDLASATSLTQDKTTARALRTALRSDREVEVLHALELVEATEADVHDALPPLLEHPSAAVRLTALKRLSARGRFDDLPAIEARFADPEDEVRAEAIQAFLALAGRRGVRMARPLLADPSPAVRGAAIAGMIRSGGLDGVLAAGTPLEHMLCDPSPILRRRAAHILGEIGVRDYVEPILTLVRDPDPSVRVAAVEAAGAMGAPELVPILVYELADRQAGRAAARALVRHGAVNEPLLLKVLLNPREDEAIRRRVPWILAQIGGPAAFVAVVDALSEASVELSLGLARCAARLRERVPDQGVDDAAILSAIRRALTVAYQTLAILEDLGLPSGDLLVEALERRVRQHIELAFELLIIRYPASSLSLAYAHLYASDKLLRANAVEVIDTVLPNEESRWLLPLIDSHDRAGTLRIGAELTDLDRREADAWLEHLLVDRSPWVVVCALHHLKARPSERWAGHAEGLVASSSPLVRETALHGLAAFARHSTAPASRLELWRGLAARGQRDATETVRAASRALLRSLGETADPTGSA